MAQPLLLSISPVAISGVGSVERKLPGLAPTRVCEVTPVWATTSPFAVLGVIVTVVTFPAVVWFPEAVARPAVASYGDAAAPETSKTMALELPPLQPLTLNVGPRMLVDVVGEAA